MATDPSPAAPQGTRWRHFARDEARRAMIGSDLALPDRVRVDDELRAGTMSARRDMAEAIARDLLARIALHVPLPDDAVAVAAGRRLLAAGMLDDADLLAEVAGRVRLSLIERRLADRRPLEDGAGLAARVAGAASPDAARAFDDYVAARTAAPMEMSLPVQRRLVWQVAAALRDRLPTGSSMAGERVVADAVAAQLAGHGRLDACAASLADTLSPLSREPGDLLVDALVDSQLPLFAALLAGALGSGVEPARDLVLHGDIAVLLTALHGIGVPRVTVARVGFLLCETDPSREVEALPETIDSVAELTRAEAAEAAAPFLIDRDYRRAIDRLNDRRRRR